MAGDLPEAVYHGSKHGSCNCIAHAKPACLLRAGGVPVLLVLVHCADHQRPSQLQQVMQAAIELAIRRNDNDHDDSNNSNNNNNGNMQGVMHGQARPDQPHHRSC